MKRKLIIIVGICIMLFLGLFVMFRNILFDDLVLNLEKYSLLSNEIIQEEFEYKNIFIRGNKKLKCSGKVVINENYCGDIMKNRIIIGL